MPQGYHTPGHQNPKNVGVRTYVHGNGGPLGTGQRRGRQGASYMNLDAQDSPLAYDERISVSSKEISV